MGVERGEAFEKGKGLCREQGLGGRYEKERKSKENGGGGARFEEMIRSLIRANMESSRWCRIDRPPEQVKETMGN